MGRVSRYLARPENVAVLTCIPLALLAGVGAYSVAADSAGFLLLTAVGVLVPGVYDRRWPRADHGPREAVRWSVAASVLAVAAFAVVYAAASLAVSTELAAVLAFLVPAFGGPLAADRVA